MIHTIPLLCNLPIDVITMIMTDMKRYEMGYINFNITSYVDGVISLVENIDDLQRVLTTQENNMI